MSTANFAGDTAFLHYDPQSYTSDEGSDDDSEVYSSEDEKAENVVGPLPSLEEGLECVLRDLESGHRQFHQREHFERVEINGRLIENLLDFLVEDKHNPRAPTALHLLATRKNDKPELKKIGPLVVFLVKHPKNPLTIRDNAGYTALHYAVEENKKELVDRMCEHEDIDSILSIQTHLNRNCLHLAVEKDVDSLPDLIRRARPGTLCAKNNEGNTPLHLAVDYAHCRPNQLSVVEAIVLKCDQEMKKSEEADDELATIPTYNINQLSPYRYHIETCKSAEKRKRKKEEEKKEKARKKMNSQSNVTGKDERLRGGKPVAPQDPTMPLDPNQAADAKSKKGIARSNTFNEAFPKDTTTKRGEKHPAMTSKALSGTAKGLSLGKEGFDLRVSQPVDTPGSKTAVVPKTDITMKGRSDDSSRPKLEIKKSQKDSSRHSKVTEDSVRGIQRFLKQHYLRTRSHDAALDIIYGKNANPDIQINFDLFGYSIMTQQTLTKKLHHVKFDDTLQYVAIPNIRIEGIANYANTAKPLALSATAAAAGNGRTDLELVFNWLRKDKGVKTILKVIVNDLKSPAHGDDAIERSLRGFNIETWDWKKSDLCSEVIEVAAPQVRVVHLYWSGNNAVLRGWSDEGGLRRLSLLRKVYIHTQEGLLDSYDRAVANFGAFKKRMGTHCSVVDVVLLGLERKISKLTMNQTKSVKEPMLQPPPHEWIKCMASFKKLLLEAEANLERNHGVSIQDQVTEPIKVALIDDGIDINELQYTPIGGRSFCPRDDNGDTLSFPWHFSSSGHGTVMASQIYRICPRTQLYVLKLEDHQNKKTGSHQITAKSAAEAIHAAIRKKVHIISMSWTIDPMELRDEKDKIRLEKAIAEAAEANILMFSSAHDNAPKEDNTYPAVAAKGKIFKIGAAKASGQTDDTVGNASRVHFTFPGNEVEMEGSTLAHKVEYRTGSSVATALAAGLAALILYCVQVKLFRSSAEERPKIEQAFNKLKKHDSMMKAFRSIGMTEGSNGKYIAVWDMFGKQVKNSETAGKDSYQLVDLVAAVGQEICIKI
ncbi:hypothetical protein BP5796_08877 [Coleophoma crateriformis]|uniref:Peptidase S8/S53 domain-containing protein n=1 Tax=Coleophoma crateriformis TaxID=565419 RepID=A0A3D8R2P7_9HELO|nr:hypothetical protein BP5796_08877 [Coleophoma crateriformis]